MPYRPRGPREWHPGMKEGVVEGPDRDTFTLRLLYTIRLKKDLKNVGFQEFRSNAEHALEEKHSVEIYVIDRKVSRKKKSIGELAWFPDSRRGGVITWRAWEEGELSAAWTDAASELDTLERWVWGEMTDVIEEEEAFEAEQPDDED